ncbi:MAG: sugar ABC transporter substrate-binding protein [Gaiellaceae bacterium]
MTRSRSAARRGTTWLWLAIVLAVGALALVAAGCGGDDDEASGDTTGTETTAAGGECDAPIWVLLPDSATSPRWETDDRKYFEEAFKAAGVDYNIVNSEGEAVTQQSQAEQAIADGAKVIVLTSNDTGSGATIIDQAKEAGVKVVEYDRFNTGGAGGDAYVSFDNVQVGRKMAEVLEPLIDDLDVDKPAVVMLNGGEEDNNSFQFRAGYAETVEKRVDAGDWTLAADQHVPGWGANGEGQGIMEQILTDNNNKIDAVFAANDNLAQQAINALEAAGVGSVPVSGQDASAAGMQNIVLGKQAMSVYKPFKDQGKVAADVGVALCKGEDFQEAATSFESELASGGSDVSIIGIDRETGEATDSAEGEGVVPYVSLVPIGVTVDNIADTVVADGFRTIEEICTGDTAETDFCQENS